MEAVVIGSNFMGLVALYKWRHSQHFHIKVCVLLATVSSVFQHMSEFERWHTKTIMLWIDRASAVALAISIGATFAYYNSVSKLVSPYRCVVLVTALSLCETCDLGLVGNYLTMRYGIVHSVWHILIFYYVAIIATDYKSLLYGERYA